MQLGAARVEQDRRRLFAAPVAELPFKARIAAARPTRQAVIDEIDRLAEAPAEGKPQGRPSMSDASISTTPPQDPQPAPQPPPPNVPALEATNVPLNQQPSRDSLAERRQLGYR